MPARRNADRDAHAHLWTWGLRCLVVVGLAAASVPIWFLLTLPEEPPPGAVRTPPLSVSLGPSPTSGPASARNASPPPPRESLSDFLGEDATPTLAQAPPPIAAAPPPSAPPRPAGAADRIPGLTPPPAPIQGPTTTTAPGEPSQDAPESPLDRRRRLVRQYGGTERTEDAVEAGLAWLAAHQDRDGTWSRDRFALHCPRGDRCAGWALTRERANLDAGLTGLCLLAFIGAGYTDQDGAYRDTVARAIDALLRAQRRHGGFSDDDTMAGYNDSLATFALAEAYALTRDPGLREPLERAVNRLVLVQQEAGGWDYWPNGSTGRNDTSISAWAVQALQSCLVAEIPVPRPALVRAALHFTRATQLDGRVRYADLGVGTVVDINGRITYRYGGAMSACAMTCCELLGWRVDAPLRLRQQSVLFSDLPSAARLQGGDAEDLHSYYYWYYGTVAMFQAGGSDWERWNGALRDAILPLQDRALNARGKPKDHTYGSWPPYGRGWGKWGRMGSRVYTTALCVLTLETYYRHAPAYLLGESSLTLEDWRHFLRSASDRDRRVATTCLQQWRIDVGEPVLVDLLDDALPDIRLDAAIALVGLGSPRGAALIADAPRELPGLTEQRVRQARQTLADLAALPPAEGTLRVLDLAQGLATVQTSRTWVGMPLVVQVDGETRARLEVVQRFPQRGVALARIIEVDASQPPTRGALVLEQR